jgi:hypothetical protein
MGVVGASLFEVDAVDPFECSAIIANIMPKEKARAKWINP